MFWNAKEQVLNIQDTQMNYITFGNGEKSLIMIQGLNTQSIKGASRSLAYMYRIFARDYKVYLFDRRENIGENITVRELAADIAMAMDFLGIQSADVFGVSFVSSDQRYISSGVISIPSAYSASLKCICSGKTVISYCSSNSFDKSDVLSVMIDTFFISCLQITILPFLFYYLC